MSLDATIKFEIEKLLEDGSNFLEWKFQIEQVLDANDYLPHLTKEEVEPTSPSTAYTTWLGKDKKAWLRINTSIATPLIRITMGKTTTKQTWDALKNHFERKGIQSAVHYMSKLYRAQLTDNGTLLTQISAMKAHAIKLESLGYAVADNLVAIAIIMSLPSTYNTLSQILTHNKTTKLDLDNVIENILWEQSRRKEHAENAFQANTSGNHHNGQQKSEIKCTNCKCTGHTIENCWRQGGGKEGQGPKQKGKSQQAKVAEVQETSTKPVSFFMAQVTATSASNGSDRHPNSWILDSGASSHMTLDQSIFRSYYPLSEHIHITPYN